MQFHIDTNSPYSNIAPIGNSESPLIPDAAVLSPLQKKTLPFHPAICRTILHPCLNYVSRQYILSWLQPISAVAALGCPSSKLAQCSQLMKQTCMEFEQRGAATTKVHWIQERKRCSQTQFKQPRVATIGVQYSEIQPFL